MQLKKVVVRPSAAAAPSGAGARAGHPVARSRSTSSVGVGSKAPGLAAAVAQAPALRSTAATVASPAVRTYASANVHFVVSAARGERLADEPLDAIAARAGGYAGSLAGVAVVTVPAAAAAATQAALRDLSGAHVSRLADMLRGASTDPTARGKTLLARLQGDALGDRLAAAMQLLARPVEMRGLSRQRKTELAYGFANLVAVMDLLYHSLRTGELVMLEQQGRLSRSDEPLPVRGRELTRLGSEARPEVLTAVRDVMVALLSAVRDLDVPVSQPLLQVTQREVEYAGLEVVTHSRASERAFVDGWLAIVQQQVDETLAFAKDPPADREGFGNPSQQGSFEHLRGAAHSLGWHPHATAPKVLGAPGAVAVMIAASRHDLGAEHAGKIVDFVLRNEETMATMARLWRARAIEQAVESTLDGVLERTAPQERAALRRSVRERATARYDENPFTLQTRVKNALADLGNGLGALPPWVDDDTYVRAAVGVFSTLLDRARTAPVRAEVLEQTLTLAENAKSRVAGVTAAKLARLAGRARAIIAAATAKAPNAEVSIVPYLAPAE